MRDLYFDHLIFDDMEAIERNEIFDMAYRFLTETKENVFLTGKAGSGKTTFLKYLKEYSTRDILVAAPTGVAAINAGGVTLHSLFQLPLFPFLPNRASREELLGKLKYNKQRQEIMRKLELLVIDEVSMVRCDVLDAIDCILRHVRRKYDSPFGGVQLLYIGDLHQLPPVVKTSEWPLLNEYYASPFFFDSLVIKEQQPLLIELDKIYRQKEEGFIALLNKVRSNEMEEDDFEAMHLRFNPTFLPPPGEKYIILSTRNDKVDMINSAKLKELHGSAFVYKALIEDDFPEHVYPAEADLMLKEGAQVMFLKNDIIQKRYFNGKIGVVKKLEENKIFVDCDGVEIEVNKEAWENLRYTLNKTTGKLEQELLGTFSQYPLRLAWAITIHKSQGLTFDKVMIDAGNSFTRGQVYVALSRCTSFEGIVLLSKINRASIHSNEEILEAQRSLMHKGSLTERFAGARQVFTLQLLEDIFSFDEVVIACEELFSALQLQNGKLGNAAITWCGELLQQTRTSKTHGSRFISEINALMKDEPEIEKNALLQQRITDAANYFEPRFSANISQLRNHPLLTEHKETSGIINPLLQELLLALHRSVYFLNYCKNAFHIVAFLQHKIQFSLPDLKISCYASGKAQNNSGIDNAELYDSLKRWRDMRCEETGMPIFMVANQATLKEIATYLPFTKNDLLQITGFGKAKVEKFGDEVLETVENYCSRFNIESNMDAIADKPRAAKKEKKERVVKREGGTKQVSFELFKAGKTVQEIAKERNLTISTIENHLCEFLQSGEIDINRLVSAKKQDQVNQAIAIHGRLSSKTLFDNLPDGISYSEIKMVLAATEPAEE